jgi:hypothetical protein
MESATEQMQNYRPLANIGSDDMADMNYKQKEMKRELIESTKQQMKKAVYAS